MEGLTGLTAAGFCGELGSGNHEHGKDFVPNPINAVVVRDDPCRQHNPNIHPLVVPTNGSVGGAAFAVYDAKRERHRARP